MHRTRWKPISVLVCLFLFLPLTSFAQTYVQSNTKAMGPGADSILAFASPPGIGNTVIVGVACYNVLFPACTVASVVDNLGNVYSQIGSTIPYGPSQNGATVSLYCADGVASGNNFTVGVS